MAAIIPLNGRDLAPAMKPRRASSALASRKGAKPKLEGRSSRAVAAWRDPTSRRRRRHLSFHQKDKKVSFSPDSFRPDASRVLDAERRLCAAMPNAAHIGSLRRKLRRADASRAGSLAPCEFGRALREFTDGNFGDGDEAALCEAYDHRAELIEDTGESMMSDPICSQEMASSRKQKTPRGEDEGIRAWVETRAFSKRRGFGTRQTGHGKSDEAMRSILWDNDDKDDTKKVPPWDAVDYERFLDNLETRAEDGPYYARRRTVRKLSEALSNDDAQNKWDEEFVGATGKKFLTPSEAVAAFANLGIDLTRREVMHAVELGSTSSKDNGLVDPRSLATRATKEAEAMDAAEEARREAFFEESRAVAESRRRGGGNAVRGVRSTVLTPKRSEDRYFYLGPNDKRPIVFRTERPSKRVDRCCWEDVEPAAGKKSDRFQEGTGTIIASQRGEKKTHRSSGGRTRHERNENLTLERATASLTERASRTKLSAAINAMPSERISSPELLQRTLSRVGATIGSRDASRILAEAAGSEGVPTRQQLTDLIIGDQMSSTPTKSASAGVREPLEEAIETQSSAFRHHHNTRKKSGDVVADRVLSEAMREIATAPNPTYATSQQLCGWCREKPIVRRGRGTARRQDSHPWQFEEDVDNGERSLAYAATTTRSIATPIKLPTRRKRLFFSAATASKHHQTSSRNEERPRCRGKSLRDYVSVS